MVQHLDIRKAISLGIVFAFLVNTLGPLPAYAQDFVLPAPGAMVHLSPVFDPPILKGIKVHPDNPFRFEFILDRGDSRLPNDALKDESSKLIKYFLASLTIPEKDLWVNLSPYEKDHIIPNSFGLTGMGRDLLAEDYMLKQITASLIYPEGETGKKFWKRIYEEAAKKFGTTNAPVNTFNKVWIVPEKAVVYENTKAGTAYVVESKLKVMLEQDYLSLQKHEGIQSGPAQAKDTNQLGSQIVREIVIPELTKEVNEDKNFSQLRQVYNSLILATWYKKKIKDSILEQVYADKNKVAGVNIDDPKEKERIYQRYLQAFRKGVYNYIKEDVDPLTQETVPRKYFSGGTTFDAASMAEALRFSADKTLVIQARADHAMVITADMTGAGSPEVKDLNNAIPATAIDALNDHSIRGSGISFRRLGLLKGAILILPGNLSATDVSAIKHSGKDFNIIFESGVPKLMPPQHFGFNGTGLSALDERLKILQSIQEYVRIRQDVKEPIVVVDWGCGDGTGLIALQKYLIEKNIGNVELIGYANRFENAWNEAPQGITFTTDIRYLKGRKVSLIYSNLGLHHFLEEKIPKEMILAHLNELKSVMDEQGVLKMFPPNPLPVAMLKEVFPTVRVIDEQDGDYEGAYYAEASLKIGSGDRAMAVNDFSRDDWYVKGHPVDLNDNLYHNLQHSINVARMAYDFAKARGLTEAQAQLFYQIGLLHDYDPGRPASTRPRVPSTLNLVEKDFQGVRSFDGRAGYSFLQNRLGWTKKEFLTAKAVIQRTEYPFDNSHSNPAYQGTSPVKEYKNILEEIKSLDPSGELLGFVLTQAPLFSEYIDKLNWYAASEDFDQLLRVTRGLTDEMNTELKLSGQAGGVKPKAYDFMVSLGDPRSFSIDRELAREEGITLDLPDLGTVLKQLPKHYAENFSRNLRGITAMRRALEGGMSEDDPGLIEIGQAAALKQEGGSNDEAMKAGSDNEVFEGFRARLLHSVFSFPLQDGRVLPLVLAQGHNYFPHVQYFINLSVMPSSDGLKEFPELKAIYEHGSNDPSKTGILGTIGVQIVFDEHDRPVLIIKYNQTNPGFSGRIPMKQRRQFLRWAESAHLKIIEAAKAMGIQRIYAKSAEYAIGTVLNYPINVQNILRVPGGSEILEQLFNKNIIEQDDDGYVSIKPNINLDSNEIRTITKDEDAFKIIWDILKQSHKMSRNNVNFNYEMPYKNKPIWEKVPVSQETEELFPYEARNSLPLWQYIGGTGGNAQIVDKDRAMVESSMTNYLGTKYKEIRLNGGATQIIPANLSASDIAEIMRGDKEFVLKLDSEGPPYLWPYTKGWDVNGTHFSELDDSFEIMNKIEELQKERKKNKSSKPIVIVDWGCGYGTGLIELQQELFRKGIRNVKLIGYSYESFPQWHNAPSGIVFTNIISYIKEADFIYSYSGLVNMFYANIMTPQESEKHLRILRNILGEKGVLRTDLLKDEEWNGKLMSKVFLIKVVDKRTRYNNTPYYIEGSYKAIPDAAMKAGDRAMNAEEIQKPSKTGGIDLSPANLNLQTHNAGQTIKFHLDPTTLKQLQNAPGFVPVIINIQPLKSLSEFLGLNQTKIT